MLKGLGTTDKRLLGWEVIAFDGWKLYILFIFVVEGYFSVFCIFSVVFLSQLLEFSAHLEHADELVEDEVLGFFGSELGLR